MLILFVDFSASVCIYIEYSFTSIFSARRATASML